MADVELDVTFETLNNQVSANFGTVYVIDNGVAVKIIADKYSNTNTYEVGDYVIDNDLLYKCVTAVEEPEEFDTEKWSLAKLANDVKNKVETTYVDEQLELKADKDNTYTKSEVDTALDSKMNKVNPTGTGSFSLNRKANTTIGDNSFAAGMNTTASGRTSYAEGVLTTASGQGSHSEGYHTTAEGNYSHAEGNDTTASGMFSHAEGYGTTASGRAQHVSGKYNIVDNNNAYAEIVGNGVDIITHSNARTLDWQGNEMIAGDLTYNGNKSLTSEISRLDGRITDLPEAMVFKGTLGVGGTVETLPTASAENEGWTFKCITAGTYAGLTLKVGDSVTCFNPPNTSVYEWDISGHGDTDTDTWRAIKVNGTEVLGNGISSGAVDFVGSENIEVDFDGNGNKVGVKTKNIYTKAEVDDIVYNILPDDTASGSVANFETDLTLPLKSLEVDINAVQESGTPTPASPLPISGWSEISLYHRGANLFNKATVINGYYIADTDGIAKSDANSKCTDFIEVKGGATYAIMTEQTSGGWGAWYDKNKNFISAITGYAKATPTTYTAPSNAFFARLTCYRAGVGNIDTFAFNTPRTATTYEQYAGTTEVIQLGGTYYGGHFTQDKDGHRQFEVTHGIALIPDLTLSYSNNSGNWENYLFYGIVSGKSRGKAVKCSKYEPVTGVVERNLPNEKLLAPTWNDYIYIRDDAYTTVADFKTANANTQLVYELATPYTIDLPDGEPIITLNGTNNIFADTGDTSVVFKVSVNGYVEKKIASVQALTLNT